MHIVTQPMYDDNFGKPYCFECGCTELYLISIGSILRFGMDDITLCHRCLVQAVKLCEEYEAHEGGIKED